MTPDDIGKLLETMSSVVEAMAGFKAKVISAGFSEEIAEQAALEFLRVMFRPPKAQL